MSYGLYFVSISRICSLLFSCHNHPKSESPSTFTGLLQQPPTASLHLLLPKPSPSNPFYTLARMSFQKANPIMSLTQKLQWFTTVLSTKTKSLNAAPVSTSFILLSSLQPSLSAPRVPCFLLPWDLFSISLESFPLPTLLVDSFLLIRS